MQPACFGLSFCLHLSPCTAWEGCQAGPLVLMKLTAVAIFKHNGDKEALLLGMASDLSSFGFFQRATVKEFLTFTARQVASRTQVGQRQKVRTRLLLHHVTMPPQGHKAWHIELRSMLLPGVCWSSSVQHRVWVPVCLLQHL